MDDKTLRQRVMDQLDYEPSIDAANIGVTVENGVVTLSGHVSSYAEKIAVERAVRRVKDIRAIAQEIAVRYPSDKKTADDQIAERVARVIAWNAMVPDGRIQATVEHGWVTLEGAVEWQFQKLAAESVVRNLTGVTGISNRVAVESGNVQTADVKAKILAALKRDAEIEANGIRIDIQGDHVILEGTVRTWSERGVAERAAWSAPGVNAVQDRLTVATH